MSRSSMCCLTAALALTSKLLAAPELALPVPAGTSAGLVDKSPGALKAAASPAAGWATSYLLNTVFAIEYNSINSAMGKTPATQTAADERQQQLAAAVWSRAYFALASLRAKGQTLPFATALAASLAANPAAKVATAADLVKAAESDIAVRGEPAVQSGFNHLAATFTGTVWASRWQTLVTAYELPPPTCPLDYAEVRTFAARQKQYLEAGRSALSIDLLAPLSGWDTAKVQCLVFALMVAPTAAQSSSGFDPLPLLAALDSAGPAALVHDSSLRTLHATRLLQLERYPEALRILLDLVADDDSYRLPYELVQRIFSWRQRGAGSVAIQGL